MVYSMYLTIKETLVGENVTSSLCESYPISTQQYTRYSGFVELGGNSYHFIYSNGTIIWICPLYSVCVIDSTCNHYCPIHFLPMPPFLHGKDPTTHLKAKSLFIKETNKSQCGSCSCAAYSVAYFGQLLLLSLVLHSDTPYYACSCCG